MDEMRELVNRLNELNYHYYVLDDPIASDDEWCSMKNGFGQWIKRRALMRFLIGKRR